MTAEPERRLRQNRATFENCGSGKDSLITVGLLEGIPIGMVRHQLKSLYETCRRLLHGRALGYIIDHLELRLETNQDTQKGLV